MCLDKTLDPANVMVHKVRRIDYENYVKGKLEKVVAECGKRWAPEMIDPTGKPECPACFPVIKYAFSIAV